MSKRLCLALILLGQLIPQAFSQPPASQPPASQPPGQPPGDPGSERHPPIPEGDGSRLGAYTTVTEAGLVPEHLYNIVLGAPQEDSIVASVLAFDDLSVYIEYGQSAEKYTGKTESVNIKSGEPLELSLTDLDADSRYYYQLRYQAAGDKDISASAVYSFHTARDVDSEFVFTVQSDSHLDENTSGEVYSKALTNALAQSPDFHLALGDTFMTGKYTEYQLSEPQYRAQRYYLGSFLTHSAPLFFSLGNHDAESGDIERKTWATNTRNKYFPNPAPSDFYTGNKEQEADIGYVKNYYSWDWGNSQFIVLDPHRYSPEKDETKKNGNWNFTLGPDQYQWLTETLESSEAEFKFVFLHNLVGASHQGRGGAEASELFEWGGLSFDGTDAFEQERPDLAKPIHQLLVENDVSVVFHGHDHMYIHQERDGLVYQLVPQPGHPSGGTASAKQYGYLQGDIIEGAGHISVSVKADEVDVQFIRASTDESKNAKVLHSYSIES